MSAVLMCDGCNELFSVNEYGWKEFSETIPVAQNNPYNNGRRTMHMCNSCAPTGGPAAKRPRISPTIEDNIPKAIADVA